VTISDTRLQPLPLSATSNSAIASGVSTNRHEEFDGVNEVEKATVDPSKPIITSKGVQIRVQAIPNMMMAEARRKIKPPKVPTYYNADKDVQEENPNDPEYIANMQEYNTRVGTMGATAMLAFGTEIVGSLPADVQPVESQGWSDDLHEILDVDVPAGGKGRYAAWLRLYVLSDQDLTDVMTAVGRASGIVREAEVEEAQDSFRPDAEGDTVTRIPVSAEG
jgi:hypothetical protein